MSKKNTSIAIFVEDLKKLKTLRRMRKTILPRARAVLNESLNKILKSSTKTSNLRIIVGKTQEETWEIGKIRYYSTVFHT